MILFKLIVYSNKIQLLYKILKENFFQKYQKNTMIK